MFCKAPIQYVITSYLQLTSIFATLLIVSITSDEESHSILLTCIYATLFLLFFLWPLLIVRFLTVNSKRLKEPTFLQKFQRLYSGVRLTSWSAIFYNAVFAVRRFNLIMANLYFNKDSPFSGAERTFHLEKSAAFLMIQTVYLSYLHQSKPHDDTIFN